VKIIRINSSQEPSRKVISVTTIEKALSDLLKEGYILKVGAGRSRSDGGNDKTRVDQGAVPSMSEIIGGYNKVVDRGELKRLVV
jgi:hypothetical protein